MSDISATPMIVPRLGDPDRKRALNVLAQRRYRQRRREKIRALEKQTRSPPGYAVAAEPTPSLVLTSAMSMQESGIQTPDFSDSSPVPQSLSGSASDVAIVGSPINAFDFDTFLNQDAFLGCSISDVTSSLTPPADIGSELQHLESSQFTFPDDQLLDVPEMQIIKASFQIAQMMGCLDNLWDLNERRVFTNESIPATTFFVPPNLVPTEIQHRVPHHPLFDIIPWPTVRSKLILMFAQPIEFRPPIARDEMALMQFVYDLEDSAEGARIYGSEYHDGKNWEVGQVLFKNWWWIFDREIVENSNALRRRRGASKLLRAP